MRLSLFQHRGMPFLPTSQSETLQRQNQPGVIRRRLYSLSLNLNIKPSTISRSKPVSSVCDSIKKCWEWGWGWILSRKPTFARDLEMNEEETVVLGTKSKGSWRHVPYKAISQLRGKLTGVDNVRSLPQTFRYDSSSYSKSYDHRGRKLVR